MGFNMVGLVFNEIQYYGIFLAAKNIFIFFKRMDYLHKYSSYKSKVSHYIRHSYGKAI